MVFGGITATLSSLEKGIKALDLLSFAELVEIVVNVTIVVGTMVTMRVIRVVDVTVIVDVSVNISESFKLTEASLNNPPLAAPGVDFVSCGSLAGFIAAMVALENSISSGSWEEC